MTVEPETIDVVGTGFTVLDRLYADGDFSGEALGGSCGNVLVSLALLRRQVAPVLSLGSDEVGEQLIDAFRIAGADTRYIWRHEGRRSPVLLQDLDTISGRHSFSFRCRETLEEFPQYEPIGREQLHSAAQLFAGCSIFYADRLSSTILEAMEVAHSAGAIVYFEPSELDSALFEEALALTTILKYSSDRLGPEIDERVAASAVLAIVTYGADGLEVRHGHERMWSEAFPASVVADTCGSGDMVSVGLIDWLLGQRAESQALGIHDLMRGVVAGQRLAAENCAFAGARGLFRHHDAAYVRSILAYSEYDN